MKIERSILKPPLILLLTCNIKANFIPGALIRIYLWNCSIIRMVDPYVENDLSLGLGTNDVSDTPVKLSTFFEMVLRIKRNAEPALKVNLY